MSKELSVVFIGCKKLGDTKGIVWFGQKTDSGLEPIDIFFKDSSLMEIIMELAPTYEYNITVSYRKVNDKWYINIWHIETPSGNVLYDYKESHPKSDR